MPRSRVLLLITAGLFVGWLGWLGYAVSQKGKTPVVSRAQVTAATTMVVAEVAVAADGTPDRKVKVTEVVGGRGDPSLVGQEIEVANLASARPPGAGTFPGAGTYLLPLVREGSRYAVAGLPRSPGYEPATPANPVVYPWTDGVKAQVAGLAP